jgi:hypothetical protein
MSLLEQAASTAQGVKRGKNMDRRDEDDELEEGKRGQARLFLLVF